jgi:hypothetical protein
MPTYTDVVTHWARHWRTLAAWGAPVPAAITIKHHEGQRRLGRARPYLCTAEILTTGDLADDLGTALHELAHLAAPGSEHHGKRWREIYARAAAEALRCDRDLFDLDVTITGLDAQVREAAGRWLARTGQQAVLKAIGVTV